MRYHTAPLVGFTAYLERMRYYSADNKKYFFPGNVFKTYVNELKVEKNNIIETTTKHRKYSLEFIFTPSGYEFKLDPGWSFFSHQPRGIMKFQGDRSYEMERFGNYQEKYVKFSLSLPIGNFRGSYYNWHAERGEFNGRVIGESVKMKAIGLHFRNYAYSKVADVQRRTTWHFDMDFTSIKLPSVQ